MPQDDPGSPFQPPLPAELYGYVPNPAHLTHRSDDESGEHDIYRGQPPAPRPPSPVPTATSSSSSSSGLSVFGAISTGVENAISRWARAWTSNSSLSSSSSSASVVTQTKSHMARRRKRRPRSIATTHNARSELEVAARIRAREDLRTIPRDFFLYAPKLPLPAAKSQAAAERRANRALLAAQDPVLRTTSLEELTGRLGVVLRERVKARRVRTESPGPSFVTVASPPPSRPLSPRLQDYMLSEEGDVARASPSIPGIAPPGKENDRKGKQKVQTVKVPRAISAAPTPKSTMSVTPELEPQRVPRAWWLDVASPTWQDMCEIGKLLHLHPLTLEDILTQDPREKLELFPKLGYYFISFRAIESQKTRERVRNLLSEDASNADDEGIVKEVNVYLVIFREGICSFHFADIDEHLDRVRHRIMLLGESANASSGWIAHGLLDSIVDSFFPYLEIIEKEVAEIEHRVFSISDDPGRSKECTPPAMGLQESSKSSPVSLDEKLSYGADLNKKHSSVDFPQASAKVAPRTRFSTPLSFPLLVRRARRAVIETLASIPRFKAIDSKTIGNDHPTTTVRRMARIRRLVTSLTRFLAVKSEVVAQVKKRLTTKGEWTLSTGTEDDIDIFVYMGDVQDHILTLQQSLAYYERTLSQSHPAFLSQLRMSVNQAKSGTDKAITTLTIISLGVLCVQTLIGLVSMNCAVPHNNLNGDKYNGFAIVICIAVVILAVYSFVVRYWWNQAKRGRLRLKD